MKLVSFNINGLKAILGKDFRTDFTGLDPDIIGLQEIKLTETEHKAFPFVPDGYEAFWTVSKVKKGYAGVAVLTRIKPQSVHYGLLAGRYDDEGRSVTLEFESFYFVCCYSPNSQNGLKRLDYRLEYERELREYLKELDRKKPVILCGDLNVAHEPIDLRHPKSNERSAGYSAEERSALDALLAEGFVDTFRSLHPTEVKYSWWSYLYGARKTNAGWRIDYFIVSKRLMDKVQGAEIRNDIYGSDHCPVELYLDL